MLSFDVRYIPPWIPGQGEAVFLVELGPKRVHRHNPLINEKRFPNQAQDSIQTACLSSMWAVSKETTDPGPSMIDRDPKSVCGRHTQSGLKRALYSTPQLPGEQSKETLITISTNVVS